MPTLVPPQQDSIGLAKVAEPGANLYNSYHFLTQLSGLYAQAMQYDPEPVTADVWRGLCDLAINDLGELYLAWEAALGEAREGRVALIDARLGQAVVRACKRAHEMSRWLNVWTPMPRWARLLQLCERRWQSFLVGFAAANPRVGERLAPVRSGSEERLSRLEKLSERYREAAAAMAPAFAVIDADGLFGGRKAGN